MCRSFSTAHKQGPFIAISIWESLVNISPVFFFFFKSNFWSFHRDSLHLQSWISSHFCICSENMDLVKTLFFFSINLIKYYINIIYPLHWPCLLSYITLLYRNKNLSSWDAMKSFNLHFLPSPIPMAMCIYSI